MFDFYESAAYQEIIVEPCETKRFGKVGFLCEKAKPTQGSTQPTRYAFTEDFPKRPQSKPRYIPEYVMQQLNENIDGLPEPLIRMVLVLQECGMRISELLHLKKDCLLQDKAGDWFLRYYQFKMKKEITIPVSREVVRVIQEQQRYIQAELGESFEYLFCSNRGGLRKRGTPNGSFIPDPRP
ncbi:MAG: tyrosine-type recombinase/integrase [Cyanobacteria bacterium J06635_15]